MTIQHLKAPVSDKTSHFHSAAPPITFFKNARLVFWRTSWMKPHVISVSEGRKSRSLLPKWAASEPNSHPQNPSGCGQTLNRLQPNRSVATRSRVIRVEMVFGKIIVVEMMFTVCSGPLACKQIILLQQGVVT